MADCHYLNFYTFPPNGHTGLIRLQVLSSKDLRHLQAAIATPTDSRQFSLLAQFLGRIDIYTVFRQ